MAEHFGRHRDAEIYTSQPGLGVVLGARVLGEFGDDPHRYADAKARKNYAGTSPITRASGTQKIVLARYARNRRLGDALQQWAFCSLNGSPGARAYYQPLRARKIGHQAALRQLANRLVGILHGCLKTDTLYDEHTAWSHHTTSRRLTPTEPGMSAAIELGTADVHPSRFQRSTGPSRNAARAVMTSGSLSYVVVMRSHPHSRCVRRRDTPTRSRRRGRPTG